jgi:hypothetical protein
MCPSNFEKHFSRDFCGALATAEYEHLAKFVPLSTVSSIVLREVVDYTPSIRGAAGRTRMLVISAF